MLLTKKACILPGEIQSSKREIGRYNMRSPVVSLKCMCRGIHKFRKSKGEEGLV